MKVVKKKIRWNPVIAADLVGYKVYIDKNPITDASFNHFVPKDKPLDGSGKVFVSIPDEIPEFTFEEDVPYNIGVSSLDDNGGESNSFLLQAAFDFVPPPMPDDVSIVDL